MQKHFITTFTQLMTAFKQLDHILPFGSQSFTKFHVQNE